ncbi:ABC transporter permease [Demequina sp.]|uniref:ABC transporter permease n=1 Tax=Demequina sp. TaxID=2050685 RepID=UPI003D0DD2B0
MSSEQAAGGAPSEYAQLAEQYGLPLQVGRPPLGKYLKDLWRSRSFIWALARTRAYARNENTYLGQLWSILTPLLYAAVYGLIFGVVLQTDRGVENYIGFLVIGVFIFQFCSSALSQGANAVVGNISMIRSLRFPRAALPIAVVVTEFLTLLPAIVVMLIIVNLTGEHPQWSWFLVVPAFALIALFNAGVALVMSRVVTHSRDVKNLIPFVVQLLRYMSGLFFSIAHYTQNFPGLGAVLTYQPYALSIEMVRGALLQEFNTSALELAVMCLWAFGLAFGGLIYFWRSEGKYGVN